MKKVGLLILVLVIALGALGVGYAKWFDTVQITGTVVTGNIDLGIKNTNSNDPGTTIDQQCQGYVATDPKNVGSTLSENNGNENSCGYYESITETISNVYPGYKAVFTNEIANCGTVPVKIESWVPVTSSGDEDLTPWMSMSWAITDEHNITINGSGNYPAFLNSLLGYQLGQNQKITIVVTTCFNEDDGNCHLLPMGNTVSATFKITASQWNEVSIPEPTP